MRCTGRQGRPVCITVVAARQPGGAERLIPARHVGTANAVSPVPVMTSPSTTRGIAEPEATLGRRREPLEPPCTACPIAVSDTRYSPGDSRCRHMHQPRELSRTRRLGLSTLTLQPDFCISPGQRPGGGECSEGWVCVLGPCGAETAPGRSVPTGRGEDRGRRAGTQYGAGDDVARIVHPGVDP